VSMNTRTQLAPTWLICARQPGTGRGGKRAQNRRSARNYGASAPGTPVTFCDGHRTDFATASGQIQMVAGILAAAQVVFASLRALHLDRSSGPAAIATAKETVGKEHCR